MTDDTYNASCASRRITALIFDAIGYERFRSELRGFIRKHKVNPCLPVYVG
jgi:hypothetical protein